MAKVSNSGVIASLAVFSVSSRAPPMIEISSCDRSPPFPACLPANVSNMTLRLLQSMKHRGGIA